MTELGFLLDLLLEHDELPKDIRLKIKDRIKEIEVRPITQGFGLTLPQTIPGQVTCIPPHLAGQAPSTIKNFMKDNPMPLNDLSPEAVPTSIVTSPAAAQALQARQAAISQGISGKPEKGRTSPRKF